MNKREGDVIRRSQAEMPIMLRRVKITDSTVDDWRWRGTSSLILRPLRWHGDDQRFDGWFVHGEGG